MKPAKSKKSDKQKESLKSKEERLFEETGFSLEKILENAAYDDDGFPLFFDPDESSLSYDDMFLSRRKVPASSKKNDK